MEYKDYYDILGVDKSADQDAIKKAYRRLARKYHPDVSKEDDAENRFKEIKEAYEVLGDPEKRKKYDMLGSKWQAGDQFGAGGFDPGSAQGDFGDFSSFTHTFSDADFDQFSDFFAEMFGGGRRQGRSAGGGQDPFAQQFTDQFQQKRRSQPRRGQDLNTELTIGLQEALEGTERNLRLKTSKGTKSLKAKIPAGIKEGQQIRLKGQGGSGQHGGPKGDLKVTVHVEVPKGYEVRDSDIYQYVPVTPWEAALGDKIQVETLHGTINVQVPKGSQTGKTLRFSGKGLAKTNKKQGDYLIVLQIHVPDAESHQAQKLYEDMKDKLYFNPRQ